MPEMTPLEIAENLEEFIHYPKLGYAKSEDITLFQIAASYLRKIASGGYVPVVHGYWKHLGYLDQCCSVCGETPDREQGETPPDYDICPYCGAVMDGKDDSYAI